MVATKLKVKPEITVESDYSRGRQRFTLKWEGYDRELFDLLKTADAKYDKPSGSGRGYMWCYPYQLRQCVENLQGAGYTVHHSENLDALAENIPEDVPKVFEIIKVTDRSVTVHFEFGPQFRGMVDAIKRIDVDERDYDAYTKDWRIQHVALTTLIWGWKKLHIDVSPLEDIQKVVGMR